MNLLFAILLFAIAIVVNIVTLRQIFNGSRCHKRIRLCYKRAKRWWKYDSEAWFTERDANLDKRWKFIERHKHSFTFSAVVIFIFVFGALLVPFCKLQWTTILSFIVGILGFVLTGGLLYQQSRNSRKQMSAEQFKNAIDHLGSKEQAIVLGGVHALHNLAVNSQKDYSKQVFEVLCSFIREATADPVYQAKVKAKIKDEEEKQKNTEESQQPDREAQKPDATSAPGRR